MPNSIQVIPFCAPLPQSEGIGVVGTITLRGQSAVIWFGWGDIEPCENDETLTMDRAVDEVVRVGNGVFSSCDEFKNIHSLTQQIHTSGNASMGSLSLSMPPPKHQINYPSPSTQLLGGTSEEDMMLGQQVSSRLAKKIGWPIFVSCSFSESGEVGGDLGLGLGVSPAMAVAVAEKEVAKILIREKQRTNATV